MKKSEIFPPLLIVLIVSVLIYFFWEKILYGLSIGLSLLLAVAFLFIIAASILWLVSIVSEVGSADDPNIYKKFLKALLIISIPLSLGLYWEWSSGAGSGVFTAIALFVWGNSAIGVIAFFWDKLFNKGRAFKINKQK